MPKKSRIKLLGFPVSIEIASSGKKINIAKRLGNGSWQGPTSFNAIFNFSDLFVKLGMRAKHAPLNKQWSAKNPPPSGIRVLEFEDKTVARDVQAISQIARRKNFYSKQHLTDEYYRLTKRVLGKVKNACQFSNYSFLALVRAGVVAGKMLGISPERQTLVQTKRLALRNKGHIAVGLSYLTQEGKVSPTLLIADPAGATYASIVANLLYLKLKNRLPRRLEIWNVVGSHQGALFAKGVMQELGISGRIVIGGYSPGMNEKYYLETRDGYPSVGDAGDALNRFLPKKLNIK